jgi:hypothetical protein
MISPAKTPAKAQGSSGVNGEQQKNAVGPKIPAFLTMTEEGMQVLFLVPFFSTFPSSTDYAQPREHRC